MTVRNERLRAALIWTEAALQDSISELATKRDDDRLALQDLTEALNLVAKWRARLDAHQWVGRSVAPSASSDRERP